MNSPAPIPKHLIATEHLSCAIELYLRGDAYFSALHLGGAAEEILSVYTREIPIGPTANLKPSFDQFKDAVLALSDPQTPTEVDETEKWIHDRMTAARNAVKHKAGRRDAQVSFDAKEEAYDIIDRAISTYFQLFSCLDLSAIAAIQDFDARRREEQKQGEAQPDIAADPG